MRFIYPSRTPQWALLLLATCWLSAPPLSLAQDSDDGFRIEEIIVTAQKREQRLMDVPISISAFTDSALADSGAAQLADFLQTAPGVGIIDNQSGTQNIQIRGINSTYGNAPVGFYLDELPFSLLGNTQVPDVRTYDLERVEILRGPQGTLYGDGSIGGTIRILTKEPDLESFAGSVDLTGSITGGASNSAIKGMLNVPLSDQAGFRLVASREDFGGWIDNTGTGIGDQNTRDVDNYRGKFLWAPNDKLDIVLSAWHTKQDVVGNANAQDDMTTPDPADNFEIEYDLFSASVRYSFDAFDVVSATSVMDYRDDSVTYIAGLFPFTVLTDQDVLSEELRLTSTGDGMLRWTAGFFYRSIEQKTLSDLPAFGFTQDLDLDSDSYAIFGEATWTVLDEKLDLTVGLRYFEDDRLFGEFVDPATLAFVQSLEPTFTGTNDQNFDSTNPRFNASYRLNDDWIVYGNISKGFRTGQPQPVISLIGAIASGVQLPLGIKPETMWSYEAGTKGTFMDGRASLEAAVYLNDWDDLQVAVVVQDPVRGLVNGGPARTQGIEIGLTLLPLEGLQLKFSGGYVNAEFTENVAGINIMDGDKIPNVPDTTLSAAATYRWPFNNSFEGFVHGSAQYASERSDTINFATPSDATTTLDLRFGLEGEVWSGYLFVDNATDEDGALGVYSPSGLATRYRPRTYGLQIRASF